MMLLLLFFADDDVVGFGVIKDYDFVYVVAAVVVSDIDVDDVVVVVFC